MSAWGRISLILQLNQINKDKVIKPDSDPFYITGFLIMHNAKKIAVINDTAIFIIYLK